MSGRMFEIRLLSMETGEVKIGISIGDQIATFTPGEANSVGIALIQTATEIINNDRQRAASRDSDPAQRDTVKVEPITERRKDAHGTRPKRHPAN